MDGPKGVTATFGYRLDVASVGGGTVVRSPNAAAYAPGTTVTLTPQPDAFHHFVGWSGDASGSQSPLAVTMDGNKSITATFAIDSYTLSVAVSGSGTVAKSPDQASYTYGTQVTLTPTPATGYHFTGWSGDTSTTANPLVLTMTRARSLTASFAIDSYTLSVTVSGSGTVAKSPNQASYTYGTVVTLTATPATGWHFVGWSGDATSSTNPLSLTMDGPKAVTAGFAINTYALTVTTNGLGTVAKSPDQASYNYGTVVTLTATPSAGTYFVSWGGDASGTTSPVTVTMDGPKGVTATFGYRLDVASVGGGTVVRSPNAAAYAPGTTVTLTPQPDAFHHFVGWSGDASGSQNPLAVTMDG
ncbi:MAG: hypothetical protein DMD82_05410, partial [Candidatus Rokuibacteriota bacterium]